ncbi:structure-specific endonuclease subunit SLX4 [Chaetomidium leptoderma]|uniref:Structure-specific endonuclease subunit SLX4 n=1 Tax=Chaetomidium leptoderma TaxID=669021 RepID=A0AAN6VNA3_9PEZI|nr:structure-specific endonuclease subunit SLX4 [Chaetomidium leptoderma]
MAHHGSVVIISSSPEFPSICDLLPKATQKPQLRSGSNAALIPDDALSAFTSAASIWQSSRLCQTEDDGTLEAELFQSTTSKKPRAAKTTALSPELPEVRANPGPVAEKGKPKAAKTTTSRKKKAEEPKSHDATDDSLKEAPAIEGPPKKPARKPRATKDPAMAQTTLPKGKVTKPAGKGTHPKKKKTETVSKHFTPPVPAPAPPPELIAEPLENEPVILEPAMRRRMDWTPPRESVPTYCIADSSTMEDPPSGPGPAQGHVFETLQDTYGRNADADVHVNTALPLATADVLGKRKLLEMVAPTGNKQTTPEASPTKPKAVKKKPRTITELATAAYRQPEAEDTSADKSKQDSLLGYLETTGGRAEPPGRAAPVKGKGSRRPAKPKPKVTKKKEQPAKQLLLSPTSAMRQVAKQDFVFGTASQLATENDPELLRALHEAMKLSNQPDSNPFVSPNPVNSNLAIRKRQGTGLWAAGARCDDGNLLNMEVLDLTRSSPLPLAHILPKASFAAQEAAVPRPAYEMPSIEIEMSDDSWDLNNSPPVSHPQQLLPPTLRLANQTIQPDDDSPLAYERPQTPTQEPDFEPPPSNQEHHQLLLSQSNSPRQDNPALPPRPSFELYTDARLAKEVASYGFKAVKKRTAIIALLNQCWESRNKPRLGGKTAQTTMSTSSANHAASPSRPRGRPRKNSVTPAADVVEPAAPSGRGRKKTASVTDVESEPAQVEKRPRGRPRKNSAASASDIAELPAPAKRGRKKATPVSQGEIEAPEVEKRPRGRPKKDATAPPAKRTVKAKVAASPRRAKSPPKPPAPVPATPKRRKATPKPILEIPDSDSEDPFASSPTSSPEKQDDIFSSPPAMDLSVTEDTETSLIASPTNQQVTLFRYITQAVVSAPRTTDPANPSWHEKMLMYDPIILEDLAAWLNAGQLDRVGFDGEVAPGDVKRWCESQSVCCLWRVNLRGKERKRL